MMSKFRLSSLTLLTLFALGWSSTVQGNIIVVNGNGNSGFGGTLGTGSLTLSNDGTTLSGSFNRGSGNLNDAVVLYFDTDLGATGFTDTSSFDDQSDGLRRAISGKRELPSADQTIAYFAPSFRANYAIAFDQNFGGLWQLSGPGSHTFVTSVSLTPTGNASAAQHDFSLNLSAMGLGPSDVMRFVGTYISTSAYRSNEALGTITVVGPVDGGGNPGFTSHIRYGDFYSLTVVPEPSSAMLAISAAGLLTMVRTRRTSKV